MVCQVCGVTLSVVDYSIVDVTCDSMWTIVRVSIDNREGGGIGNARTSMRRMLDTVT